MVLVHCTDPPLPRDLLFFRGRAPGDYFLSFCNDSIFTEENSQGNTIDSERKHIRESIDSKGKPPAKTSVRKEKTNFHHTTQITRNRNYISGISPTTEQEFNYYDEKMINFRQRYSHYFPRSHSCGYVVQPRSPGPDVEESLF